MFSFSHNTLVIISGFEQKTINIVYVVQQASYHDMSKTDHESINNYVSA